MQTFIPYPRFQQCAEVLDNGRLNNQVNESFVILKIIYESTKPRKVRRTEWKPINIRCPPWLSLDVLRIGEYESNEHTVKSAAWMNHPATKMWKDHRWALLCYTYTIVRELEARGMRTERHRNNLSQFGLEQTQEELEHEDYLANDLANYSSDYNHRNSFPWWLGHEPIHKSHRAALLIKNLEFYSKYGWRETPEEKYIWPV